MCCYAMCSHTSHCHLLLVYVLVLLAFIIQFPSSLSGETGTNTRRERIQSSGPVNNIETSWNGIKSKTAAFYLQPFQFFSKKKRVLFMHEQRVHAAVERRGEDLNSLQQWVCSHTHSCSRRDSGSVCFYTSAVRRSSRALEYSQIPEEKKTLTDCLFIDLLVSLSL